MTDDDDDCHVYDEDVEDDYDAGVHEDVHDDRINAADEDVAVAEDSDFAGDVLDDDDDDDDGHICIPRRPLMKASLQGEIQCSGRRPLHWIEPCLAAQ